MSISPVSYSKSENGEVIPNGSTQKTHHIDVTESWNKEVGVRYAKIYSVMRETYSEPKFMINRSIIQ